MLLLLQARILATWDVRSRAEQGGLGEREGVVGGKKRERDIMERWSREGEDVCACERERGWEGVVNIT